MKKELTALLLCAAVVMAQGPGPRMVAGGPGRSGGFGGGGMELLGGRVVTGAAYSAVEVLTIQEKFADGNSVNTTTSTPRARDGQGRTYVSETVTPPAATGIAPYTRMTIMDPVAGFRYELNSSTMVAVQSRLPKMRPETMRSETSASSSAGAGRAVRGAAPVAALGTVTRQNGAVVTTSSNGTATVNGVLATHTQVTEVIPAGAIGNAQPITTTRTTYISQDLKLPVQIKTSDPRFGTSDMELTNISTGEPSAALFQVPPGYTIRSAGPEGRGPGGRGPGGGRGPSGRGPGGGRGGSGGRGPGGRGPGGFWPGGPPPSQ